MQLPRQSSQCDACHSNMVLHNELGGVGLAKQLESGERPQYVRPGSHLCSVTNKARSRAVTNQWPYFMPIMHG
jgi:hypothetical protein